MEQLFNYGEFLLCLGPFLIIVLIFGGLLWNSLPDRRKKAKDEASEK